ncbi:MAG TPA: PilN domain-containing protein [Candidatus Baltobacteraceae bacterium]|nr:PilN domain-containing protein [Candidatus Baltobacteraceae bacterium]
MQSVYESRLAQIEAGGRQRARTYQRVRELSAVLERASGIAGSARKQARVIAVVAEALPPHVWLTSIRRDDAGLLLQGKAGGLSGIATLVRRLSASRVLRRPLLSSVTMPEGNLRAEPLTYTLHVDVAAQS